ncbi:MAG: hypothetical protein ABSB79_06240 [Syntrophales bacterium]
MLTSPTTVYTESIDNMKINRRYLMVKARIFKMLSNVVETDSQLHSEVKIGIHDWFTIKPSKNELPLGKLVDQRGIDTLLGKLEELLSVPMTIPGKVMTKPIRYFNNLISFVSMWPPAEKRSFRYLNVI